MRKIYEKRTLWKSLRWLCLCFALVTILFAAFPMEASADSLASVKYSGTTVVTDIAATQDGKLLYITESGSSPIYSMNADGSNQTTLGSQTFMFPKFLFVDHSNNIFVLDYDSASWANLRITKLDSSGNIIWQSNYMDDPDTIDMAAFDNYVYLVDSDYNTLRIYSYNSGTLGNVNQIGGMFADSEPYYPSGVTIRWNSSTSANEVYFTDEYRDITNGRTHGVYKMNATGGNLEIVNKNVGDISPSQIAVDSSGNVYFVDGGSGINKITAGIKTLLLSAPHSASDITVGPTGVVYVTCYNTGVTPTTYDITRLALTPVVSGLSVSSGPVTGGTSLTINGLGFSGASAVSFGGTAASSFTVNSDTSITATAPAKSGGALGLVNIIVTAPGGTSVAGSGSQFTYTPGPAVSLTVSASGTQAAGTSFPVTVTAKDQFGNTATGYRGTVHFSTNNGTSPNSNGPSLPGNYTFTAGDAGTHVFNGVVLYNKAASTISAADTVTGSIAGITGTITVNPGEVNDSYSTILYGKESVTANDADSTTISVTLKDAYKNLVNNKTVALDKGSGESTIAPASVISGADGTAVFTVKSTKAETVTYTVWVNSEETGLTRQVTFTPGTAVRLTASAGVIQIAGTPFAVTVTARDQFDNIATSYAGIIHFTTTNGNSPSSAAPSLPADYTFTASDAGIHIFNGVVLYNKATSTISAADTVTGSISGATGNITVGQGLANAGHSTAAAGKNTVTADNTDVTTITVTLKDAYDNPVNGSTVTLDQGSGHSAISPTSVISAADGTAAFTVRSTKAEWVTYAVEVNGNAIGLTSQVTFIPGAAVSLSVSTGAIQAAGIPFLVTVAAIDQNGNIATGYTGTIHFTTTNGNSPSGAEPSLPPDYTFTTSDAGIHTFMESTLYREATSTITAADTVTGSIHGVTVNIAVVPGPAVAGHSTIAAIKTTVLADNIDNTTITITLKDAYDNPASGRTVALDQGGGHSVILPSSADTGADGTASFAVRSTKAELVTYEVEVSGSAIGLTRQVTFTPGAAVDLTVSTAAIQTAGAPFIITVSAIDQNGNIATGYTGTIQFTTTNLNSPSGAQPSLPSDYTYTASDAGIHVFGGVVLFNKKDSTISAEDTVASGISETTGTITVRPGSANAVNSTVLTDKISVQADNTDHATITVTLQDAYENLVNDRSVNLNQGSGHSNISPASITTDADGKAVFTVSSTRTEAVTYAAVSITDGVTIDQKPLVTFTPGTAAGLTVSAAGIQTAGISFTVTVAAIDPNGNIATGYTGTVHFTTTNGNSPNGTEPLLPPDYTFTVSDAGIHVFSGVKLYNKSTATISATDTGNASVSGITASIIVGAAPADAGLSGVIPGKATVTADNTDQTTITVTLKDAYENLVSGKPVTLDQGGASSNISPITATSGVDGTATFAVKSTRAEAVTYAAIATADSITVAQTAHIRFTAGETDAVHSTVTADKSPVAANDTDHSTITVTLKDVYDNPVSGSAVILDQGSGSSTISPTGVTSGADGKATFIVSSSTVEIVTYTAISTTDSTTLQQDATVSFLTGHAINISVQPASGGTVTGGGVYCEGSQVSLTAVAEIRYRFVNWTEGGAEVSTSSAITFAMGMADRNLTANFLSTGSSSGGGPAAPASTQEVKFAGTGVKEITLQTTIDQNKNSAKIILGNQADTILRGEGAGAITVPPIPGVNSYTLGIPAASLSGSQGNGALAFKTEKGSITITENMLSGMQGTSGKEAGIEIGEADKSKLTAEVRERIGDRPVVQLSLTLNGAQTDWNNPEAPVTVALPYKPSTDELAHPEQIVVWYIDGGGNAVSVPNGHYDPETGTVTFVTTHFSYYAIGYHKVSFKDVPESAWYSDAVSFIAARGITTGTGNGKYSPKAKLTRGEFLVMMMRAYGLEQDTDLSNNFADAGNTYYSGYLAAAKKLGITSGVGNNQFAPGKQITRQEMVTLLYNALKGIDRLPEGTENSSLSAFRDASRIAFWAKDAMTLFVETGTVSGSGGKLSPSNTTTRTEMAQVFYNLLSK